MEEPDYLENDLEERLLSVRNMVDLTLLAFREDRHELIYTALEQAFVKLQSLLDDYCIVR